MDLLSIVSIALSVTALIVSIVALNKASSIPANNSYGGAPADLRSGGQLSTQLIKMPSDTEHGVIAQDYRLWLTNIGGGTAYNVNLQIELNEPVLFQQEIDEKLGRDLAPGDRFEFCTRIGVRSPRTFKVITSWDTPEGLTMVAEDWVTKETD